MKQVMVLLMIVSKMSTAINMQKAQIQFSVLVDIFIKQRHKLIQRGVLGWKLSL